MAGYLSDAYVNFVTHPYVQQIVDGVPQTPILTPMVDYPFQDGCVNRAGTPIFISDRAGIYSLSGGAFSQINATPGSLICINGNNDLFIWSEPNLVKISDGSVVATTFVSSTQTPCGICVDKNNNVYLSMSDNTLKKYNSAGSFQQSISISMSGFLCCDLNDHIWCASKTSTPVKEIINMVAQTALTQTGTPQGICCDQNNNIFVSIGASNIVRKIVNSTTQSNIPGFISPSRLCCNRKNSILVPHKNTNSFRYILSGATDSSSQTVLDANPIQIFTGMDSALVFGWGNPGSQAMTGGM